MTSINTHAKCPSCTRYRQYKKTTPQQSYMGGALSIRAALCALLFCVGTAINLTPSYAAVDDDSNAILSIAFSDWNRDGIPDKASLVKPFGDHEYATLRINLSSTTDETRDVSIVLDDFAWDGLAAGTKASLTLSENGSLIVNSGNTSIGRNRWRQSLFVAYRKQKMVIAGFVYRTRDTLTRDVIECDVNYLAGFGFMNSERFTFGRQSLSLNEWSDDKVTEICH